jgi:hypothetical protein
MVKPKNQRRMPVRRLDTFKAALSCLNILLQVILTAESLLKHLGR